MKAKKGRLRTQDRQRILEELRRLKMATIATGACA